MPDKLTHEEKIEMQTAHNLWVENRDEDCKSFREAFAAGWIAYGAYIRKLEPRVMDSFKECPELDILANQMEANGCMEIGYVDITLTVEGLRSIMQYIRELGARIQRYEAEIVPFSDEMNKLYEELWREGDINWHHRLATTLEMFLSGRREKSGHETQKGQP